MFFNYKIMEQKLVQYFNKLTKWLINNKIDFIGHDYLEEKEDIQILTLLKSDSKTFYLWFFFCQEDNDEDVHECYVTYFDNKPIIAFSGTLEECLIKISSYIN